MSNIISSVYHRSSTANIVKLENLIITDSGDIFLLLIFSLKKNVPVCADCMRIVFSIYLFRKRISVLFKTVMVMRTNCSNVNAPSSYFHKLYSHNGSAVDFLR